MVGYWTHSQILEMLASDNHSSLFDYGISNAINVKAMNAIKSHKIAHC
jgi:hypothetical protein